MPAAQQLVIDHPDPNPEWLARHTETILDPNLPIIDPHHHLWDRPGSKYYLDELLADLNAGHNVVATVFLQCFWAYRTGGPELMRPVGETEFVASVAAEAERRKSRPAVCAAIVGHVDFRAGEAVDAVLEAHIAAAGGRFRGIRQVSARHPDFLASLSTPPPFGLLNDPAFRTGFARLDKYGLSFDAWLYHTQLGELRDLARAFPETPIVINHVGGPLGVGPYRGKTRCGVRRLAGRDPATRRYARMCMSSSVAWPWRSTASTSISSPCRRRRNELAACVAAMDGTRASRCSAPRAACSKATSRWTRRCAAIRCCGMPSSGLPAMPRPMSAGRCFMIPRHRFYRIGG